MTPRGGAQEIIRRVASILLVAASALYLLVVLSVAIARQGYPYDLEWMEGGVADHVARVAAGSPLYVPPSIDFTPYLYTPLYYYAGAAAWAIAGEGIPALRMLSLIASIGCFLLIALMVHHETGSRAAALVAAGSFAACFRAGGAWLDLARNDALFLFLTLAGAFCARGASPLAAIASGILLFLAFFTKQTALVAVAPLLLGGLLLFPHRGAWVRLAPPIVLAALVAASTWAMNVASDGWYGFYVFDLPAQHPVESPGLVGFWLTDLARTVPIALGIGIAGIVSLRGRRDAFFFHGLLGIGLIGASWSGRLHSGGYDNVLLPAFAGISIALGIGVAGTIRDRADELPSASGGIVRALLPALALAQVLMLAWDPREAVPSSGDREAGDRIVALIRDLPGDVLVPGRGNLARRAGRPASAHDMALDDVFRGDARDVQERLASDIREVIRSRRYGAILLDYTPWGIFQAEIEAGYDHRGRLLRDPDDFMPRTGLPTRPDHLYVRREADRP